MIPIMHPISNNTMITSIVLVLIMDLFVWFWFKVFCCVFLQHESKIIVIHGVFIAHFFDMVESLAALCASV